MASAEHKPGLIERFTHISRDVGIAIAGIAALAGKYGIAALSAIGAVIDNEILKRLKKKRQ